MLQIGIALFLGCFFFGSILSNFIWQDTAWWIGSAGDTDWQQILADGEQRERFFGQVLILRGIPWIILQEQFCLRGYEVKPQPDYSS